MQQRRALIPRQPAKLLTASASRTVRLRPNAYHAASAVHDGHRMSAGAEASSSYRARASFTPLTASGRSRKYSREGHRDQLMHGCIESPSRPMSCQYITEALRS